MSVVDEHNEACPRGNTDWFKEQAPLWQACSVLIIEEKFTTLLLFEKSTSTMRYKYPREAEVDLGSREPFVS